MCKEPGAVAFEKEKINIGITSIGSGIGQSVVDSCRLSNIPMKVIGHGLNPFAFGSFDCDEQKYVPSIYSGDYIEKLLHACATDSIRILIPGLDDELMLLAENIDKFNNAGVRIPISGRKMLELCRDKELMSRALNREAEYFVKSYSKDALIQAARRSEIQYQLIAKPISGFSSKGLLIIKGPDDLGLITCRHVIQEIAVPRSTDPCYREFMDGLEKNIVSQVGEISLQIVIGKNGRELGRYASYNRLRQGIPIEIIPADVPDAWASVDRLLPIFHEYGLYGPLNIQGRITHKGPRFFEMNARFTGITGLRAMTGFNEVEAIVADVVDFLDPGFKLQQDLRKIGLRQVKSRVVDVEENTDLANAVHATGVYPWVTRGRTVMVTGANSYLGRTVLATLLATPGIQKVIALVRNSARFDGVNGLLCLPELRFWIFPH
ncbi:MAG: hypothetical protein H0X43_09120 [Nitrosospira sp.]|nr:hypothetical protein [Nitrosospira sp.]